MYSAEEKAALALYNYEEQKRKEEKVLGELKALVAQQTGDGGTGGMFESGGTQHSAV